MRIAELGGTLGGSNSELPILRVGRQAFLPLLSGNPELKADFALWG